MIDKDGVATPVPTQCHCGEKAEYFRYSIDRTVQLFGMCPDCLQAGCDDEESEYDLFYCKRMEYDK